MPPTVKPTTPNAPATFLRHAHWPALAVAVAAAVILTALSPTVWVVLLTDGVYVLALVAAACGWGAWPAVWLGFARRSVLQQVCIATAVGLGLLALIALALGAAGVLTPPTAWLLVTLGCAFGLVRVYAAQRNVRCRRAAPSAPGAGESARLAALVLLLPLAVPLAIAVFGACLPPGVLWNAEARGYDVLEYHLQVPREYFDAGRIHFLSHNVYASFPQQVETLYLLLMYLAGTPLAAAIPAQLLHLTLGILAVAALAAWSPGGWARRIVVLAAASAPWLAYLGCLAYVELGMLFFGAVAAGLVLDVVRGDRDSPEPTVQQEVDRSRKPAHWGICLAAGVCAGLAGGCKYIALALVAAPLAVLLTFVPRGSLGARLQRLGLFAAGVVVAFGPWLVRNVAFTGNPVYPFAYEWFGGKSWSTEQDEQWARGHRLPPDRNSVADRAAVAWNEIVMSGMFGPALVILALLGVLRGQRTAVAMLGLWSILILLVWAGRTHMPGRFVVPIVIPLALLAGHGLCPPHRRTLSRSPGAPDNIPLSPGKGAAPNNIPLPPREGAGGGSNPLPSGPRSSLPRKGGGVLMGGLTLLLCCIAFVGATANGLTLTRLLRQENRAWASYGVPLRTLVGATEGYARYQPLNNVLPPAGRAWLIGEARAFYLPPQAHYTVVFSRDPWLEFARTASPTESVAWLRTQNVAHVVFSWPEIERLKRSYGFPAWVTPQWAQSLVPAGLTRLDTGGDTPGGEIAVYEVLSR